MDDIHKSGIVKGLQNLLISSEYSDLIIRSGTEEFKVHRAIICPRSTFFAAACNGPFQEGKTGIITLQDDDTPTVRRMLKYLYTLDYDDKGEAASVATYGHGKGASGNLQAATVTEEEQLYKHDSPVYHELLNNVAVYAIADKYGIPELEALAAKKFYGAVQDSMLVRDLASLRAIIDVVFDTTPETNCGPRKTMISYCERWKEEIIAKQDSAAIVRDYGEIGWTMIRRMSLEHNESEREWIARAEEMIKREFTLIWHIEQISVAAKCMKVSDSREVQQNYIDAQHRRLRDLRAAIHAAMDYIRTDKE